MKKKIIGVGIAIIVVILLLFLTGCGNTNETSNEQQNEEKQISSYKTISKEEEKVGCYADVNGDGSPDGIIYADLSVEKNGMWNHDYNTYSYKAIPNVKEYYISQTNYEGPFGTKDVLTAIEGEGQDRLYVMSLTDVEQGKSYCWYEKAFEKMNDYKETTSIGFGTGKNNTITMIDKWNNSEYGEKNTEKDMWGVIQDEVKDGWFVPSREEWCAFGDRLGITVDNYQNYGLKVWYWTSSQATNKDAWIAMCGSSDMNGNDVDLSACTVRLSITF